MPDKPLFLVRHARNKCRLWKIDLAEIEATLDHPEHQAPTIKDRVNYWRAWQGQWLQVTALDEGTRIRCRVGHSKAQDSTMKITYDPEADILYIILRDVVPADSTDIEEGVSVEVDQNGHITAVEIMDASERLTPEELSSIHYENLMLTQEPEEAPEPAKASKTR